VSRLILRVYRSGYDYHFDKVVKKTLESEQEHFTNHRFSDV
jgi:hypothetical protein